MVKLDFIIGVGFWYVLIFDVFDWIVLMILF